MAITGVPRMKMMLVAYIAQMKSGKRNQVMPGRAHFVDGDDEIQAGEDRRKAGDENAQRGGDHVRVRDKCC